IGRGGGLLHSVGWAVQVWCTLEKKRHRNLQDVRNLLQPAGADPVRALLVFLDLLEREAKPIAELLLAHAQHHATHAHTAPDMLVDGVGSLLGYHNDLLSSSGCS